MTKYVKMTYHVINNLHDLTPYICKDMVENPNKDTDPHDQRLFVGLYLETGVGPKGSAGVGFCVS